MIVYYIVKGASKGDNVYPYEAASKDAALKQLKQDYGKGMTVELLNKEDYEKHQKRILAEKLKEAEAPGKLNDSNAPLVD